MTKAGVKGNSVVCESFNKTMFVFLSEEAQDECFLTRLDYSVSSVHQDAWAGGGWGGGRESKFKVQKRHVIFMLAFIDSSQFS